MMAWLKSVLDRIEGWIAAIPFLRLWFSVVLMALVLITVWPWIQTLPLWPIMTKGRIFVESPEVYTRERLVNDRYGQAFWLERQLEKLDASTNFTTTRRDMALKLAFEPGGETKLPPLLELSAPPFEHEFQIRTALRARIRQALLENQLDDRHDLTGNSVYGLKFDTSVIPGRNTRTRAYVRVRVVTPELPKPDRLPELLRHSLEDLRRDKDNEFTEFPDHYENWIDNIEWRLNSYLGDIPELDDASETSNERDDGWPCKRERLSENDKENTTKILAESLAKVLAIDERSIVFPESLFPEQPFGTTGSIDLPEPWKRYLQITLAHNETCRNWKQFVAEPLRQYLLLAPEQDVSKLDGAEQENFAKAYFQIGGQSLPEDDADKSIYAIFVQRQNPDGSPWPSREEFERLQLQFKLDAESLQTIRQHEGGYEGCIDPLGVAPDDKDVCRATGLFVGVEVGMYNFARDILSSDSYLYTVFPKSDVSGLLERSLLASSLGLDAGGNKGALSSTTTEAASRLVASQLSFSDDEGKGEIVFGWIVGSEGLQQPVQKSQFVLLSLPAYLPRLKLEVETGWLDRNSDFHPEDRQTPITMSVALPPDYEAFDTLISGSKRYGPAIFDRLMERVKVDACREASILVPGARLWRSSLVTLAGQQADQIIVMPNMRGIIAHFERVAPLASGKAAIQVWTSEGSDRIDGKVIIRPAANKDCKPPDVVDQTADEPIPEAGR